jgi:SpoIID/LytB domain protein
MPHRRPTARVGVGPLAAFAALTAATALTASKPVTEVTTIAGDPAPPAAAGAPPAPAVSPTAAGAPGPASARGSVGGPGSVASAGRDGGATARAETYPVPATGVYRLIGHGYGHGHGMSQYGARGAALAGRPAAAILGAYYPGSTAGMVAPTAPIRVRLLGAFPNQVPVLGAAGLRVSDAATGAVYPMTDPRPQYRLVATRSGMFLQYTRDAGRHWVTHPLGTGRPHVGPLSFAAAGPLRLLLPAGTARDYEGTLTAVRTGGYTVATVNALAHEAYVAGVVGREMPASWPAAALRAQAVAARSYSGYERAHAPAGRAWDTCDSTTCQVYGGRRLYAGGRVVDLQPASVLAAVAATAGQVRSYAGGPIFAQFSASNGGYSSAGALPYLVAAPDPYDGVGNPWRLWTHTLRGADLARCGRLRTLSGVTVLAREGYGDWGGRLALLRLTGTAGSGAPSHTDLTGAAVRRCFPTVFPSTYATFW